MKNTRTEYSARNTAAAVISRMMAILMGFAVRVVFTHTLSETYVGLSGLFSNIIICSSVLSARFLTRSCRGLRQAWENRKQRIILNPEKLFLFADIIVYGLWILIK